MSQNNSGLRLNLDLGTALQIEIQGLDAKIKTRLIGLETWEYLIIKAPVGYAGIRNKMVVGNKVIVRYAQEGNVYGFEAFILAIIDKPTSLLVIDYPNNVVEKSLRKSERKDCYITCMLDVDGKEAEGTLVDISASGCRCLAPQLYLTDTQGPQIGKSISLVFDSPAEDFQVVLDGTIVNNTEYHAAVRLGIKFNEGNIDKISHIDKLITYLDK